VVSKTVVGRIGLLNGKAGEGAIDAVKHVDDCEHKQAKEAPESSKQYGELS
jgi:hypothetical protein